MLTTDSIAGQRKILASNPPDHAYDPQLRDDADLHAEARSRGYRLAVQCLTCKSWLVNAKSVAAHRGPVCRSREGDSVA